MRFLPSWVCTLALALGLTALSSLASAQEGSADPPNEYQVKGAFLFNFAKFTNWPPDAFASAEAPIAIGIVGQDPFGTMLDEMVAGERINGRAITIRRLTSRDDLRACHILFISLSERRRLPDILKALAGASVLTVSDMDAFAGNGGVIRLTKEDYRIGLEVNLAAAGRAHLRISSRLLSLATIVEGGGAEGAPHP